MERRLAAIIIVLCFLLSGCGYGGKPVSPPAEKTGSAVRSIDGVSGDSATAKPEVSQEVERLLTYFSFIDQVIVLIDNRLERDVSLYTHRENALWFSDELLPLVQDRKDRLLLELVSPETEGNRQSLEAQLDRTEAAVRAFSAAFAQKDDVLYSRASQILQTLKHEQGRLGREWSSLR
ncbi:hypothetical protein GTO91_01690 [Heliobacterium undosum]|uniref:Uncharacterized protein n=1 Tax=Heliomicrobium undosum TaxID=121734 RepID=A0A845L0J5_9FIRM|nr:hypothetical protein [Heliomicrobium undosum]MZP28435.1 hypothetical protein [Heliomicrobium undosum]